MLNPSLPQAAAGWQRSALAVLWRLGVPARAGRCIRSGAAVTLELVPVHPETMPAVLKAAPALQAALAVPQAVTVRQSGRLALVDVPLPRRLARVGTLDRLPPARGLALPLGRGLDGAAVVLDLGNPATPHGLIAGATGSGKSNAVRLVLRQLLAGAAPGLRVVLVDPDGATFPHAFPVAVDRADVAAALAWTAAELERRAGTHVPAGPVVLFVDEVQAVLNNSANRAALESITARGRKHAVHAVLATSNPAAVPRTIGQNLRFRLAGGTVDYHASMGAVGMVGAERLPLGMMILQPGGRRLAVPLVDLVDLEPWFGSEAIAAPWTVPQAVPAPSPAVLAGVPQDVAEFIRGHLGDTGKAPGIGTIARRFSVGKRRAADWQAAAGRRDGWSGGGDSPPVLELEPAPTLATVPEVLR